LPHFALLFFKGLVIGLIELRQERKLKQKYGGKPVPNFATFLPVKLMSQSTLPLKAQFFSVILIFSIV